MISNLSISESNISGKLLVQAMIKAHATVMGDMEQKQAAGVGIYKKYLKENSNRSEEWVKKTIHSELEPETVVARATLSHKWLEAAGRLVEMTTGTNERKNLLAQIITVLPEFSDLSVALEIKLPELNLEMIKISGGKYKIGSKIFFKNNPLRNETVKIFEIGKTEVTNEQYGVFLSQTGYKNPRFWEDPCFGKNRSTHPVVGVTFDDTLFFAEKWLGMTLPSSIQWEIAARGNEGYDYPWGGKWDSSKATFETDGTRPVDECHPAGDSSFGVWDMTGNAQEWTTDWYSCSKEYSSNRLPRETHKIIHGGSWFNTNEKSLLCAYQSKEMPGYSNNRIGFRVANNERSYLIELFPFNRGRRF